MGYIIEKRAPPTKREEGENERQRSGLGGEGGGAQGEYKGVPSSTLVCDKTCINNGFV